MFRSLVAARPSLHPQRRVIPASSLRAFSMTPLLLRDAFTLGVAAIFLEAVSLVFYRGPMRRGWIGSFACVFWSSRRAGLPGRWSGLGGSMRRAATRGMQETGNLSVALSEAMDSNT